MKDKLAYLGHASLKITTREGKVIYIDPFAGEESYYETPADLILVTHEHYDHNEISKIKITPQMSSLPEHHIDYAFFPTDGYYTMSTEEAAQAANEVQAKHNIPYHMTAADKGDFSQEVADKFNAKNKLIIQKGEEIILQ